MYTVYNIYFVMSHVAALLSEDDRLDPQWCDRKLLEMTAVTESAKSWGSLTDRA